MPKRDIDELSVVGDAAVFGEKRTIAWKFTNFAELEHKRGERVKGLDSLPCHGHLWSLNLFPRGEDKSSKDSENVSVRLKLDSTGEMRAHYMVRVGDHQIMCQRREGRVFQGCRKTGWGFKEFCQRDVLLTKLVEGDLLVEVDIQVPLDATKHVLPRNRLSQDMLAMLSSGKGSDVTFLVGGTKIQAHYNILAFRALTLAELAEDKRDGSEIALDGVDEEMFNALLRNVYGEEPPPAEMLDENARDLLDMADRFGCENMKLIAESKLVETGIKTETAADLLLFSDAKNCASLKEATLDYIKTNTANVMKTPDWEKVKESSALLSEFMEAAFSKSSPAEGSDDLDCMPVATLRRELQKKRLSEDGTRAMLVERLKTTPAKKPRMET